VIEEIIKMIVKSKKEVVNIEGWDIREPRGEVGETNQRSKWTTPILGLGS
jgi:hypothetical protein